MTTEQRLELLVDKLLVKTQEDLCEWKKITNHKFLLKIPPVAEIQIANNGSNNIVMSIIRGDIEIASLSTEKTENSLRRLYDHVRTYQENLVNTHIGKLMEELNKLGEKPF